GEVSFDFVGRQKLWYAISGAILAISVIAVVVFGFNFSVDFKGGALFKFPATAGESISQVRQAVSSNGGGGDAIVQRIVPLGGSQAPQWQVQTHPLSPAQRDQ